MIKQSTFYVEKQNKTKKLFIFNNFLKIFRDCTHYSTTRSLTLHCSTLSNPPTYCSAPSSTPTPVLHIPASAMAVTVIDFNIMRLIKAKVLESNSNNQEAAFFKMIRV